MDYDVIIIGAGPAGYVAAIRAGQLGLKTALIEKKHLGGMCLNWGCVPTKAFIESAKFFHKLKDTSKFGIDGVDLKKVKFNWGVTKNRATGIVSKLNNGIEYLLKKYGVELIKGEAKITTNRSISVENRTLITKNIIIATGSYPNAIPGNFDQKLVLNMDKIFTIEEIPQNIVIFGMGATVVEMAQFFNYIGKSVTIIANNENLLVRADQYLTDFIYRKLKSEKIKIIFAEKIDSYKDQIIETGGNKVKCELLLNCNMRNAVLPKSEIEIELTPNGFIATDDYLCTNQVGIYAIGDVHGKSFFAHAASAQGIWVINHIKGVREELKLDNYPTNIYTNPEIAQIGLSENQIKEKGIPYKLSEFPLSANAKAQIEGNTEGVVRIFSETKYGQVLGVQIIAANATDMIAEAQAFMQSEGTVYDVAQTIHAHPTVSEIFMEAGFDAIDKAIHK